MDTIGFIGLGLMGSPMSRRLQSGGFPMVVWNRTREKAEPLLGAGARWAGSPREVAAQSDIVITMVTDSAASEAVAFGPSGILEGAHPGLVLMDMSSITPDSSRTIAERAAAVGVAMMDAPVTGSVAAAGEGKLGIMAGGSKELFERCMPVLQRLGTKIVHAGKNGDGCAVKLLTNLILGVALEAVCESMVLATKLGIDPAIVMEITTVGGAQTGAMTTRGPRILARDFTPRFTINNQHKDLVAALAMARQSQTPVPIASAAKEMYEAARAQGNGELDSSALITVLEQLANVKVSGK
jgi:3-hydroxyisobutyrate dehydrogenase-like beta-hydroxyacid dehydrogenase